VPDPCQHHGLDEHNIKRKIHLAPPMELDPHLNEDAELLARQLYKTWKPKGSGFHLAGFRGSSNIVAIRLPLLGNNHNKYRFHIEMKMRYLFFLLFLDCQSCSLAKFNLTASCKSSSGNDDVITLVGLLAL